MSIKVFVEWLVFFVFFTNYYAGAVIDIECIPLENCPKAMELISIKKFAPETIQFLRNSHCGYSENKAPLVWCPNLSNCRTPDGRNGTCTDMVDCQSLLRTSTTTNALKAYRCKEYLKNSVQVCCPKDTGEMHTRFVANDVSGDYEERKATALEEDEGFVGDQPYQSSGERYYPNSIGREFPKNHHDRVHHHFDKVHHSHIQGSSFSHEPENIDKNNQGGLDTLTRDISNNIGDEDYPRNHIFESVSSICGRQTANDDKIVGGTTVDLGEFPWMALLQYTSQQGKKFGCGGTLISKRHVLTAAHCVDSTVLKAKNLELYKVILGEYDTRNETDCIYLPFGTNCADPPQTYGIKSVVKHKKFNLVNGTDDIAVIYLDREVEFTDYIKPICLPSGTSTIKTNESLTVAGWGRTMITENFSPIMKKAKLPNAKKDDCDQHGKTLTKGQICTGFGNGVNTCTGDSGGPLMLARVQNFEFVTYQMGVVSYGFVAKGCGTAPSVNTLVPHYIDWIEQNLS